MAIVTTGRRAFLVGVAGILFSAQGAARAIPRGPDILAGPRPAHPHRVIVKYRPTVNACVQCLLARGVPFATVTGRDALDRLNRRFGVRGARPLFVDDQPGGGRTAAYQRAVDAARSRFPLRAARAPAGGVTPDLSNVFLLSLAADANPEEAAAAFAADPDVEYAEPDYVMHMTLTPDDPFLSSSGSWGQPFADLWGLQTTAAATAWDTSRGDGVTVAVIDTGVRYTHVDLRDNMWLNPGEIPANKIDDDGNGFVDDVYGWDFVKNKSKPKDHHGHGTHVAGIIAATGNNGLGVVGMAWGARIMSVRGLDSHGSGFTSDLAKAIVYAAENGADVLNNSWTGPFSSTVSDAVGTATGLGAVVVFGAGNSNSSYLGPAFDPQVIAVAATDYQDQRAYFSNWGLNISVAAPGVDVLSLRGPGRVGGKTVGGKYRVLSGTSMAAPHVAGLAAVLLSAQPGLAADEVRWHLELNADQPGYPGYEGQPFNPYLGYGRINAARVFDTPPVTTRVRPPAINLLTTPLNPTVIGLHGFAGAMLPEAFSVDFGFTTHDPVDWSLTGPAWLVPAVGSGTGPAAVSLSLDATGLAAGDYDGSLTIAAPAASDGGASVAVRAHAHQDPSVGPPIDVGPRSSSGVPCVASDGQGVLIVWVDYPAGGGIQLVGARVDEQGPVTGPFVIDAGGCIDAFCYMKTPSKVAVAFDGSNYLVVWDDTLDRFVSELSLRKERTEYLKAVRVTPSGQVLDTPPVVVASKTEVENPDNSFDTGYYDLNVAFDGTAYTVLWGMLDFSRNAPEPVQVFIRRVGSDASASTAPVKIYPAATTALPQFIVPAIACVSGSCLVAWHEADGEIGPYGNYVDKLYAQRYSGDVAVDAAPFRILTDAEAITALASSGSGYLAAGYRNVWCPGPTFCGYDIVGARVGADGTALDPDGIRLNHSGPNGSPVSILPYAATFDGTSYIVTWSEYRGTTAADGFTPFAARVATDGSVLDPDAEGVLLGLQPLTIWGEPLIASTATRSMLIWDDSSSPGHLIAQGVFPHP